MTRIASIGTGNMGKALLLGMAATTAETELLATTRSTASAAALQEEFAAAGMRVTVTNLEDDPAANREAAGGADFVFLGVKPWMMADTVADLAPSLRPDAVLVSMAAGVSAAAIGAHAPGNPVVRIMPNTPVELGHGVIAFAPVADARPADGAGDATAGDTVGAQARPVAEAGEAQLRQLRELLSGAGVVVDTTEDELHLATAVAGSGVGYFFLLAEALVASAMAQGLSAETARDLVVGTADGAGRLLAKHSDPTALRQAVTSKNGTTEAAFKSFAADDFHTIVDRAARAAADRSRQIAAGD